MQSVQVNDTAYENCMGEGRVGGIETSHKFSLGLYVADMYKESDHKVPGKFCTERMQV